MGAIHRMLTRPTYISRREFNKRSKAKTLKPTDQVIAVPVLPLIDQETFDAVQAHLKSRNPKVTPPQVVGGPTMLTGICFCADCGGAMTIRTGKSGRHRYYTCSIAARQGATGCKGRSIPMERLDDLVAAHQARPSGRSSDWGEAASPQAWPGGMRDRTAGASGQRRSHSAICALSGVT